MSRVVPWTSRAITPQEAAILFHPDRATPWAPSIVVHLREPLHAPLAAARLAEIAAEHPILDARLDRTDWIAGSGRLALEPSADALEVLRTRFVLADGPPVRVALAGGGRQLVIVGHHAALDGRALIEIAAALLGRAAAVGGGQSPGAEAPGGATQPPATGGPVEALRRLRRPADRVAPSFAAPHGESFVAADVPTGVAPRAAFQAAAATEAVAAWNAARAVPWARIGLTIPVGGEPVVIGNVSTHRRVDLVLPADVGRAVAEALAHAAEPPGAGLSPARARLLRVLAPLVDRLSDSLLVSNLGRADLPGARAVDFYPQARGRSAVAVGACTPVGGDARITLRARDLTPADADALLARIAAELARGGVEGS